MSDILRLRFREGKMALKTPMLRSATSSISTLVDAEKDPMPAGYAVTWEKVKTDLARGVEQWKQGSRKARRPG